MIGYAWTSESIVVCKGVGSAWCSGARRRRHQLGIKGQPRSFIRADERCPVIDVEPMGLKGGKTQGRERGSHPRKVRS